MNAARDEAMIDGSLETPVAGAARYFLIGSDPNVLFPLFVSMIPNASGESTGLPTEPEPNRPWLMHAGRISAHIMVHGK
jgi:hypothetical protein